MTATTSQKPSLTEHAAADLTAAIATLRTEDGWQRWLQAKAACHTYSLNNQLLIFGQRPTATLCRGARQWETHFNRRLIAGERKNAIWVLAPRTKKLDDVDDNGELKTITYFRGVRIFDVSQTEQIPNLPEIPLRPPTAEVTGDSHADWLEPLTELADSLGYTTAFTTTGLGDAKGSANATDRTIKVSDELPPNEQVHILIHELVHAHGIDYDEGRDRAEACTEAAAWLACSAIGLDVSASSVPYIAGWHEDAEEVIHADLTRIDKIAKLITGCRNQTEPEASTPPTPSAACS